jgi:hypothetical protein
MYENVTWSFAANGELKLTRKVPVQSEPEIDEIARKVPFTFIWKFADVKAQISEPPELT